MYVDLLLIVSTYLPTYMYTGTIFYVNVVDKEEKQQEAASSSIISKTLPSTLPSPDPLKQPQFVDLRSSPQEGEGQLKEEQQFVYQFTTGPKVGR